VAGYWTPITPDAGPVLQAGAQRGTTLDEEYLEAQTRAFRSKKPSLSYEDYLAQKAANGMPVREASDSKPE
jgi:hypothetical protein